MLPPVISVKGKPFECGQQYGTQAQKIIRQNVAVYFDMWRTLWGAEREAILEKSHALVEVIGGYDAGILEELEGVAKGAELPLDEIIAKSVSHGGSVSVPMPMRTCRAAQKARASTALLLYLIPKCQRHDELRVPSTVLFTLMGAISTVNKTPQSPRMDEVQNGSLADAPRTVGARAAIPLARACRWPYAANWLTRAPGRR